MVQSIQVHLIRFVPESKPSSELYGKVVSQIPMVGILMYVTKEGMARCKVLHCKMPF